MKLAYCIHSLHLARGIERGVTFKANAFCSIPGNEVYIITANLHGRPAAYPLDSRVKVIDLGASDRLGITYGRYFRRLRRCLNELKPDIAVSMGDNSVYALSKMDFGGRKISEYHFSFEKFHMKYGGNPIGRLYADWRRNMIALAVRRMDAFVVLTETDCRDWASLVPGVRYIYNPPTIQTTVQAPLQSRNAIAVGQLAPQKNWPDMLAAWRKVRDVHPDWTLNIYGSGKQRKMVERLVSRYFPDGGVVLKGRTSDVVSAFLDSSMLLLSSKYEGFPMVLLEASQCGVPAVSYDCPKGPAEMIDNGINGILVPAGDIDALAAGACRLIEDPELRKAMGAAALLKCSRFSQESVIAQWQALWDELLRNRK